MRIFLDKPQTSYDCTIIIQTKKELPDRTEDGVWHGLEYYDYIDGEALTYHFNEIGGKPFAVTRFLKNGDIFIDVCSGFESYFEGSTGIFNRIGVEMMLLKYGGMLLHASLIEYQGKAIAFTGPSGIGKSTQADIWHKRLGADIINGDRAAIRKVDGEWRAYGSPFAGTSGIYKNKNAPLSAIVVLKQSKENKLVPLNAAEAFGIIYSEISIHQWDKRFVSDITDIYLDLLNAVPVYLLECLPNEDAATILKKGLLL
ncbi:MAG: hypothetical protein IKU48_04750 [Clostridia bacterium]|nr:hypothetical protein [Clostridia bacterium]